MTLKYEKSAKHNYIIYSLLPLFIYFQSGLKYQSTGQLSCIFYSLTLEVSSTLECMCKTPKRRTEQPSSITEKPTHESTANANGTISFLSFSRGRWHYRLTGLCLPKRLFTLRWKVRVNRLECGDKGGKMRTSTNPDFKIQIPNTQRNIPGGKSQKNREFLMN